MNSDEIRIKALQLFKDTYHAFPRSADDWKMIEDVVRYAQYGSWRRHEEATDVAEVHTFPKAGLAQ